MDEGFIDTLTHIRGYRSPEHEFARQARVFRQNPRSLRPSRTSAQDAHPR